MKRLSLAFLCAAAIVSAQDNPLSSETKLLYGMVTGNILKSAQKMPAANFAYKPVETVRSFAAVVGHIADSQYLFCSAVKGESSRQISKRPKPRRKDWSPLSKRRSPTALRSTTL